MRLEEEGRRMEQVWNIRVVADSFAQGVTFEIKLVGMLLQKKEKWSHLKETAVAIVQKIQRGNYSTPGEFYGKCFPRKIAELLDGSFFSSETDVVLHGKMLEDFDIGSLCKTNTF
jgi:hypothetical protein